MRPQAEIGGGGKGCAPKQRCTQQHPPIHVGGGAASLPRQLLRCSIHLCYAIRPSSRHDVGSLCCACVAAGGTAAGGCAAAAGLVAGTDCTAAAVLGQQLRYAEVCHRGTQLIRQQHVAAGGAQGWRQREVVRERCGLRWEGCGRIGSRAGGIQQQAARCMAWQRTSRRHAE